MLCDRNVQSFLQILEASRSRIDSVELDHREFEDEGKAGDINFIIEQ